MLSEPNAEEQSYQCRENETYAVRLFLIMTKCSNDIYVYLRIVLQCLSPPPSLLSSPYRRYRKTNVLKRPVGI